MANKERRGGYFKGYATGRKFDRSLTLYVVAAFALGVLVEFLVTIIAT